MGDALHVNGGVTDAREARLAQAGLIAVQGPSMLDARTGVMAGPNATALVTSTTSTAPMRVSVAAHQWVTTRGSANGPYLGVLEAPTTVDIAAAPGSGTRIDVIYVKQQDSTPGVPTADATTAPLYGVKAGTVGGGKPTLTDIVGAEELATVQVNAGATATNGAGVTITNTARVTAARGAPVVCRTLTEANTMTGYPGADQIIVANSWRRWHDGTRWRFHGDHVTVANNAERDALGTAAYPGLQCTVTATNREFIRETTNAWRYLSGAAGALLEDAATGITTVTGWFLTSSKLKNLGNGTAYVSVVARSNGFVVNATGNIPNSPVAVLPAGWGPAVPFSSLQTLGTGRMTMGYLREDRGVWITTTSPGADSTNTEDFELAGIYPLADPNAI